MADIAWEATAQKAGWIKVACDPSPDRNDDGPCLFHEKEDRAWPLDDWEGALRDLGFDENDEDWADDIVYLPSVEPTFPRF